MNLLAQYPSECNDVSSLILPKLTILYGDWPAKTDATGDCPKPTRKTSYEERHVGNQWGWVMSLADFVCWEWMSALIIDYQWTLAFFKSPGTPASTWQYRAAQWGHPKTPKYTNESHNLAWYNSIGRVDAANWATIYASRIHYVTCFRNRFGRCIQAQLILSASSHRSTDLARRMFGW